MWYKFMMDNAFPIKKHNQYYLDLWRTHPHFFWSRWPFPHPLWWLHLGFNFIHINSRLISCYDVLKKVFITICVGKQFLTVFNTFLFLIVSQQMRHKFCTNATYLKFLSRNLMARFYADAHFVSIFLDSYTTISMNSFDMVVVCWCGRLSRPVIITDWHSVLFKMLKPLISLRSAHTVLPICLVNELKCLCKIFTKFPAKFHARTHTCARARTHTHTRCSSSSFIVTLSLIWRTACARTQFSGCSLTTNAHSETGQMAVCFQNINPGALSSHNVLSVLVGAQFKKFCLFLNMPHNYLMLLVFVHHLVFKMYRKIKTEFWQLICVRNVVMTFYVQKNRQWIKPRN